MIEYKSKSDKRLIVECTVNEKPANFLIDTGASLALIDKGAKKKYDLNVGKKYPGTIMGAGGELDNVRYCNTLIELGDKVMGQFLITDISNIIDSIERETGVEVIGIIGLPQMKMVGIQIDVNDGLIMVE